MEDFPPGLSARFDHRVPLGEGTAFRVYACRDARLGWPRVLVAGAASVDAAWAAEKLDRLGKAHSAVRHPCVPQVDARGSLDGVEYLTFDCDGTVTVAGLMRWHASMGKERVGYEEAIGLIEIIGDALGAAHRSRDPHTAAPICLPTLGAANLLVSPDGRLSIIGFGHDVMSSSGPGPRAVVPGTCQAPEIAAGQPATPAADVYAFFHFVRSLLPYVRLPKALDEAYESSPEWRAAFSRLQLCACAFDPRDRFQSFDELLPIYRRGWTHLGYEASSQRTIDHFRALQSERSRGTRLCVARDGSWFELPPQPRVSLARRPSLQTILSLLAHARVEAPGRATPVDEIVRAGWPGDILVRRSGASRAYVAISTLRKLGLGALLRTTSDGYLLDDATAVSLIGADSETLDRAS